MVRRALGLILALSALPLIVPDLAVAQDERNVVAVLQYENNTGDEKYRNLPYIGVMEETPE